MFRVVAVGRRTILMLAVMLALTGTGAARQDAGILAVTSRAIGVDALKTVRYTGTGFVYTFAQNVRPDAPYPKFRATYVRTIDYAQRLSREETVRTQFENPPRGGGGQPLYREARGVMAAGDDTSTWGGAAVAITPHGFVAAALAASAGVGPGGDRDRKLTAVSFTTSRGFTVTGYINAQHLVERVDTWVPNPILGDTLIQTRYANYRNFGGVQFPTRIVQEQGGFPTLEITVSEVQPNAEVTLTAPPVTTQTVRASGQPIAPGVWYLSGAPDPNSQLVEFTDFTVLIESSVTEARALANIAEARRLVPNKPIRYHVNSHHHGDHAAGLRAFIAEGATVITHQMNRPFYEETVLLNPHRLEPDLLSQRRRAANFVWVDDKYVVTDGSRSLEIYHMPSGHTANLLMAYLPSEKLLFITDIFNDFGEPRPNDPPPGIVSPYYAALGDRIRSLKLDVERLAPSHGRGVLGADRLTAALQGKVQAPQVQK